MLGGTELSNHRLEGGRCVAQSAGDSDAPLAHCGEGSGAHLKRNYRQAKKQKEDARKARQAEKQQRRQQRTEDADDPSQPPIVAPQTATDESSPPESD